MTTNATERSDTGVHATVAEQALATMAARHIPPTPANFTVWYTYFEGANPTLRHAIDIILRNDGTFTDERNQAVYSQYCQDPLLALPLEAISATLARQAATLTVSLDETRVSITEFDRDLVSASNQIAAVTETASLQDVIVNLLAATRDVAGRNRVLEDKINECSLEIGQLRDDLMEARRQASTDGLTGLTNRKTFDRVLQEAIEAEPEHGTLSLLYLDIDHFKQFNDTHGHLAGDQVLKLLARVLVGNVKGQDTVARFGGEEFVVLLPRTSPANALTLARTICRAVSERRLTNLKTSTDFGRLTVSIGVCCFRPGEAAREFVDRADHAMYAAKRSGRNRVVLAESAAPGVVLFGR